MAKNIFIINVHSLIDVITNSSSEIFIFKNDKNVYIIKELLCKLIDIYNSVKKGKDKIIFADVFGEIYSIDSISDLQRYLSIVDSYKGSYNIDYEDKNWYKKYDEKMREWRDKEINKFEEYKGKIVIKSAFDNSIPYCIQEFIEDLFEAERTHLG